MLWNRQSTAALFWSVVPRSRSHSLTWSTSQQSAGSSHPVFDQKFGCVAGVAGEEASFSPMSMTTRSESASRPSMSSTGGPVNGSMGLLSRSVAVASPAATRTRPHPEGVDQCVEPALRVSAGKGESVGKVAVLFASAVNVRCGLRLPHRGHHERRLRWRELQNDRRRLRSRCTASSRRARPRRRRSSSFALIRAVSTESDNPINLVDHGGEHG